MRNYPFAIASYIELIPEIEKESNKLFKFPSFDAVCSELGSIPDGALFLGMGNDGLPLLLNMNDSMPGAILVVGDEHSGKTDFLKNVARFIERSFKDDVVQFAVITKDVSAWSDFNSKHCAGVISIYENASRDLVLSLSAWAHCNRRNQAVVLLIDGIEKTNNWNTESMDDLQWLLNNGAQKKVWTIASLSSETLSHWESSIQYFRTLIYGHCDIREVNTSLPDFSYLYSGNQFVMMEGNDWFNFWIPSVS